LLKRRGVKMIPESYVCFHCQKEIFANETLVSNKNGKKYTQFPEGSFSHAYCLAKNNTNEASSKTTWDKFKYKSTFYEPCALCKGVMPISFLTIKFNDLYYHTKCYEDEFLTQRK